MWLLKRLLAFSAYMVDSPTSVSCAELSQPAAGCRFIFTQQTWKWQSSSNIDLPIHFQLPRSACEGDSLVHLGTQKYIEIWRCSTSSRRIWGKQQINAIYRARKSCRGRLGMVWWFILSLSPMWCQQVVVTDLRKSVLLSKTVIE